MMPSKSRERGGVFTVERDGRAPSSFVAVKTRASGLRAWGLACYACIRQFRQVFGCRPTASDPTLELRLRNIRWEQPEFMKAAPNTLCASRRAWDDEYVWLQRSTHQSCDRVGVYAAQFRYVFGFTPRAGKTYRVTFDVDRLNEKQETKGALR